MIVSENRTPPEEIFRRLMANTDAVLNADAQCREDYYTGRGGQRLEKDVFDAICECAKGTPFENSIQLVSGSAFPDIVAGGYYGVEVKSTNKNHWTSIGSSILESTRVDGVERIYLTFGKLGKPVQFLSKPYQDCLSGIAVTHYPRYQINMQLSENETIFHKMGITYDELRKMDNPVEPVSRYYRSQLKPGESLWWAGNRIEEAAPVMVRLWTSLNLEEKDRLCAQGYAFFPEIFSSDYKRYTLWLVTAKGIVHTDVRDSFSAGGKVERPLSSGELVRVPAVFGRAWRYRELIRAAIENADAEILREFWHLSGPLPEDRLAYWCDLAASASKIQLHIARDVLRTIFYL